jgi:cytochrome c553
MKKIILGLTVSLALSSGVAIAGDAAAGKDKSAMCAACHGAAGVSPMDAYPNLAGQKAAYLAKQLHAFRDGTRENMMMGPVAKGLSDEDIENLAAYYSSL